LSPVLFSLLINELYDYFEQNWMRGIL
jgi:hypothetical protein